MWPLSSPLCSFFLFRFPLVCVCSCSSSSALLVPTSSLAQCKHKIPDVLQTFLLPALFRCSVVLFFFFFFLLLFCVFSFVIFSVLVNKLAVFLECMHTFFYLPFIFFFFSTYTFYFSAFFSSRHFFITRDSFPPLLTPRRYSHMFVPCARETVCLSFVHLRLLSFPHPPSPLRLVSSSRSRKTERSDILISFRNWPVQPGRR